MTAFDVNYEASELKLNLLTLKAVAENFSRRFTEAEDNTFSVQTAPEEYIYLYRAVFNLICEVKDQAIRLENMTGELVDQENLRGTPGDLKEDFSRVMEPKGRKGREK